MDLQEIQPLPDLLAFHEPYAAVGVLINEMVVLQRETTARHAAYPRLRVKLNGVLLAGRIHKTQGLVLSLYDIQENISPFWRHCIIQCDGGISAHQGSMSPPPMMTTAIPRGRAMISIPRRRTMGMMTAASALVRGTRMRMRMMIVAAGNHPAHCKKGDSSGELLWVLQRKHTNPSCFPNQPVPLGCIIPEGNWRILSTRLNYHKNK